MGLMTRSIGKLAFLVTFLVCPVIGWAQAEAESQSEGTVSQQSADNVDDIANAKEIAATKATLMEAERIVFLGDSTTHAAEYIVQLEAAILETFGENLRR